MHAFAWSWWPTLPAVPIGYAAVLGPVAALVCGALLLAYFRAPASQHPGGAGRHARWWPLFRPYFFPAQSGDAMWMLTTWGSVAMRRVCLSMAPLRLGSLADKLRTGGDDWAWDPVAIAALYLGQVLFNELRYFAFLKLKLSAMGEVSGTAFNQLLALDVQFHEAEATDTLLRVLQRGVKASATIVQHGLMDFVPAVVDVGLMCWIVWSTYGQTRVAVLVAASLVPYAAVSYVFLRWKAAVREAAVARSDAAQTHALDVLNNVASVQQLAAEPEERRRYARLLLLEQRGHSASWLVVQVGGVTKHAMLTAVLGCSLALAASAVVDGALGAGQFVGIATYIMQVYRPLNRLDRELDTAVTAVSDLRRLAVVLGAEPAVAAPPQPATNSTRLSRAGLEFADVSFVHQRTGRGVHGVSFVVQPGEVVALCGPNGGGKSTLHRLATRLYDADTGVVRVGGVAVTALPPRQLRRAVVVVDQGYAVFFRSIRDNITMGLSDGAGPDAPVTDADVDTALLNVGMLRRVRRLPDGVHTVVGATGGGTSLSGGERQRVVLARALLHLRHRRPPPRLVLMDEATSAMDAVSEAQCMRALLTECRRVGCSVLLAAHRLSPLPPVVSRFVVLRDGGVEEVGSHDVLLRRAGTYATMWHAQQAGQDSGSSAT